MAIPEKRITVRDVKIEFEDATAVTPISGEVVYEGEGSLSISGLQQGDAELLIFYDRDMISDVRLGQQQPVDISFNYEATTLLEGTEKIPLDAVRKTGAFLAGVSTWGVNAADPWLIKLKFTIEGTDRGGADQVVTIPYFRGKANISEGKPMTIEISGQALPKGATAAVTIA